MSLALSPTHTRIHTRSSPSFPLVPAPVCGTLPPRAASLPYLSPSTFHLPPSTAAAASAANQRTPRPACFAPPCHRRCRRRPTRRRSSGPFASRPSSTTPTETPRPTRSTSLSASPTVRRRQRAPIAPPGEERGAERERRRRRRREREPETDPFSFPSFPPSLVSFSPLSLAPLPQHTRVYSIHNVHCAVALQRFVSKRRCTLHWLACN